MLYLKSFEDISGLDAGWLKAKHHFAMGPYGNRRRHHESGSFVLFQVTVGEDSLPCSLGGHRH